MTLIKSKAHEKFASLFKRFYSWNNDDVHMPVTYGTAFKITMRIIVYK